MSSLFSDLLVIDCASFIAGPAAATMMSDFGARVVKIEPPGVGDSYRQLMKLPGVPQADRDYYWTLDSRNKESLALDLKHKRARPVFEALVKKADVFITNFPGPIRQKLKLAPEDVMALNPRLIYASLTPYGEDGPEKDRTGYDATAWWARSGLMDSVRSSGAAEPGLSVPGMGDHPTAVALYGAIVTALYKRERSGMGSVVSTSLLANGIWSNACFVQAALCGADMSVRLERGQRSALTEIYPCKDGRWFMLVMINQVREWPVLLRAINREDWASDPRFATPVERRANVTILVEELEKIFITRNWAEWQKAFTDAGVTYGPIAKAADHTTCPQVAANNFLPEFADTPGLRTVDSPIRVSGEVKKQPLMAPDIGQHTRTILAECGLSDVEITQMLTDGAAA